MADELAVDSREVALLRARKRELLDSLRLIREDRASGTIDLEAYETARDRYELEAAAVLEQLDELEGSSQSAQPRLPTTSSALNRRHAIVAGTLALLLAALILFLIGSTHGRSGNETITGAQPPGVSTPAAAPSSSLLAAQAQVRGHPQSIPALLILGQAYLDTGNLTAADEIYRRAIAIDPARPEAPTLDALILASRRQYGPALTQLKRVEQRNPTYARAWLTDGLIASRRRPGYARAIGAWKRFLALSPPGKLATEIRSSLAGLERAVRSSR